MSIFDQVSQSLSSAANSLSGAASGAFDRVTGAVGSAGAAGMLAGAAGTIGTGILKSRLPPGVGPAVSAVINAGGKVKAGDLIGAARGILNSGVFTAKLPWLDGAAATAGFMMDRSRAMGGVTPLEAQRIMKQSLETNFARKNLFIVTIMEQPIAQSNVATGSGLQFFNLFVLDVSYSPITITAEQHKVGSAVLDQPNGSEAIELRITTMDDEHGSIRRWFGALSARVTNQDGTFGLPASYLTKISVTHSFVTDDSASHWLNGQMPLSETSYFRPVSIESELSRKDDALEEFTLVFHQFDTSFPS
jgi:hypothetical protein